MSLPNREHSDLELRREVPSPAPRNGARAAALVAACGGISAGLVTAALLWGHTPRRHLEPTATMLQAPAVAMTEASLPPPAGPLFTGPLVSLTMPAPDCPAPAVTKAPPRLGEPGLPPDTASARVSGVAVSPGGRVVAAWSDTSLAISRTSGHNFTLHALQSPVVHAAVSRAGRVYVLRDDKQLGVFAATGQPRWHATEFHGGVGLAAAAGHLVWYGEVWRGKRQDPVLALSRDDGKTWRLREAPFVGNFSAALRVDESGLVQVMNGSEAGCGGGSQDRAVTTVSGSKWRDASWPMDAPTTWMIGAKGWAYAVDEGCGGNDSTPRLCAIGPAPDAKVRAGMTMKGLDEVAVASNGSNSIAIIGKQLVRMRGGAMTPLRDPAPHELSALHLDTKDRLWGVSRGYVVRLTPGIGWRTVFPSPSSVSFAPAPAKP